MNTPEYRLTVPSTDEEIKFRPFLVKEEKLLLIAQQTGDENAIYDAIKKLIENLSAEGLKGEIAAINGLDLDGEDLSVHKGLTVRKHSSF